MANQQNTKWPSVFYTVWDEAWIALTQPRQYIRWAYQPFGRSLAYLSILLAVFAVAITVYFFLNIRPQIRAGQEWIAQNLPQVTFTDSRMSIAGDETFLLSDNEQIFFKVDPTESLENVEADPFYEVTVLILNDGVYVRDGEDVNQLTYQDLRITQASFDGQDVSTAIDKMINALKVVGPLLIFGYLMLSNLVLTFVLSFIAYLFSGLRAPLKAFWSMAVYALTPALIAGYLAYLFIPNVSGISTLVLLIYFTLANINFHKFLDFQANYGKSEK